MLFASVLRWICDDCCSAYYYTIPDSSITKSRLAWISSQPDNDIVSRSVSETYQSLYLDRSDVDQLSTRQRTFLLWPGWAPRSVDPDHLAEAGFFYTGEDDQVRCYGCRETFSNWKDGDIPLDVHQRRSPTCPVVIALRRSSLKPAPCFVSGHLKALPKDVQTDCVSKDTADEYVDSGKTRLDVKSHKTTAIKTNLSKPGILKANDWNITYLLLVKQIMWH